MSGAIRSPPPAPNGPITIKTAPPSTKPRNQWLLAVRKSDASRSEVPHRAMSRQLSEEISLQGGRQDLPPLRRTPAFRSTPGIRPATAFRPTVASKALVRYVRNTSTRAVRCASAAMDRWVSHAPRARRPKPVRGLGRLQPPAPSSSLLLDALDPDDAEAGVFIADVRLKCVLFGVECLDRFHISEL